MKDVMKKILCFIYEGFADFESVLVCSGVSGTEGYTVEYIAYEDSPILTSSGTRIIPDKLVSEISDTKNIEGIIFPGGAERELRPELKQLILRLNDEKKMIAAICAGPEFLAKAGILNGIKYTTSQTAEVYEENNIPDPFPRKTYVEERLVQDGNIITAQGHAFVDFALKVWDLHNAYDYEGEREELKESFTPL
ncbi:MAG: DJ-1/PfpI family protein [Promethearchaeota archaeon]|jgi:putative intracellular protease/amidase